MKNFIKIIVLLLLSSILVISSCDENYQKQKKFSFRDVLYNELIDSYYIRVSDDIEYINLYNYISSNISFKVYSEDLIDITNSVHQYRLVTDIDTLIFQYVNEGDETISYKLQLIKEKTYKFKVVNEDNNELYSNKFNSHSNVCLNDIKEFLFKKHYSLSFYNNEQLVEDDIILTSDITLIAKYTYVPFTIRLIDAYNENSPTAYFVTINEDNKVLLPTIDNNIYYIDEYFNKEGQQLLEYYDESLGDKFYGKVCLKEYNLNVYIKDEIVRTKKYHYMEYINIDELLNGLIDSSLGEYLGVYYYEYDKDYRFTDDVYSFSKDMNIYLLFNEEKSITVNLNAFGGEVNKAITGKDNDNVLLPIPTLPGYKFIKWSTSIDFDDEVLSIVINEYNNEQYYALYTKEADCLNSEVIITKYNESTDPYKDVVIFAKGESISASLYWNKVGIKYINNKYIVTGIVESGKSISELGDYDFVIMAYSKSSYFKQLTSDKISLYNEVFLLKDINKELKGNIVNMASFINSSINDNIDIIKESLKSKLDSIVIIEKNIDLDYTIEGINIEYRSSNTDVLSNLGEYFKPQTNTQVTLNVYAYGLLVYSKEFIAIGNSTRKYLSTGYVYTNTKTITQNAMNTLDIIYPSFLYVDANGDFTNLSNIISNINNYIRDKAKLSKTKIVVSINQKDKSFSEIVKSDASINNLVNNIVNLLNAYSLDGIDIDWETPTTNEAPLFTKLCKAIYTRIKEENSSYLLTAAIGGGKWQPPKYDLVNSAKYLDYINVMLYSMTSSNSYYQNALYKSTKGATLTSCSVDESIDIYDSYNVPHSKLLLGIPFYGIVQSDAYGPGSKKGSGNSCTYSTIINTHMKSPTMKSFFDEESGVPYLYDDANHIFVSYEDDRSINLKSNYIKLKGMAGMMFWQYGQDVNDMLTNSIRKHLDK